MARNGILIHRLSNGSFALGILAAVSCGMPNPIERNRFPAAADTGYADGIDQVPLGARAAAGDASTSGCPEDITLIFNRPLQQGGCQGAGCHTPGNTSPDLTSPNPAERLLGVASQCNGRPYIAADDSFLVDKIIGSPPECGSAMPFSMADALSAQDEGCILAWVDAVSGG
jgi:hypothetical protein